MIKIVQNTQASSHISVSSKVSSICEEIFNNSKLLRLYWGTLGLIKVNNFEELTTQKKQHKQYASPVMFVN